MCAVSNEGSVNAWTFPEAPRPLSPEVQLEEIPGDIVDAEEAVVSRASTPREATPPIEAEEGERDADMAAGNENEATDNIDEAETDPTVDGKAITEEKEAEEVEEQKEGEPGSKEDTNEVEGGGDVEMAEVVDEKTTTEEAAEAKVDAGEPAIAGAEVSTPKPQTDDIDMVESKATVPAPSAGPSRLPSPQRTRKPEPTKKRAGQLQRIRHVVFNPASLLVLAFDPLGRCVLHNRPERS